MLMRKTSAPARNRLAIMLRSEEAGPRVATILVRRRRRIRARSVYVESKTRGDALWILCLVAFSAENRKSTFPENALIAASGRRRRLAGPAGHRRRLQHGHARLQWLHWRLVCRFGELDGPGRLVAGIDFEEAGAVVAARQAIVGAADGEFLFPRAHEGLTRPFAAAVVVDRVDVIEAGDERAPQYGLATAGGNVPPTFRGPAVVLLVADGDPDPIAGVVAEAEVGLGRPGCQHERRRQR